MPGLTTCAACPACGAPLDITPESLPACPACFQLFEDGALVSVAYTGEAQLDADETLETLRGSKRGQTEWKKRKYYVSRSSLLPAFHTLTSFPSPYPSPALSSQPIREPC